MGKKRKDFPFPPKIRNFPFLVVIFQWKQKNYVLHFFKNSRAAFPESFCVTFRESFHVKFC